MRRIHDANYKYEVTSLEGFVQRVATHLLTKGYYFFVQGCVPDGKSPELLDAKLLAKYDVVKSEGARYWRKSLGLGNVQYVRFGRHWILLATHGDHFIREGEGKNLRDVRKTPIQIGGYSICVRRGNFLKKRLGNEPAAIDGRWRVRVLISRERYKELKGYFLSICCHRSLESLCQELWSIPYEPYAPVRKQMLSLLRQMNAKRQTAGLVTIPTSTLRYRRTIVKSFEPPITDTVAVSFAVQQLAIDAA